MSNPLFIRALRITQGEDIPIYSFFLRGNQILQIAQISRIKKGAGGNLFGYQRGEVQRHISEIVDYLDSGSVIFPNAILLAMSSEVRFKQSRGPKVGNGESQAGVLEIPIHEGGTKASWIVDGQQRTIALSKAKRSNLLVPVTAFVTDDLEIHRSQFLLVNKVKPLPSSLINELLPTVNTTLPPSLAKNKIPSALCDILNRDPESPFKDLIIRETTDRKENKTAVIKDNSLLHVIRTSLNSPHGCLYQFRNIASGATDNESMRRALNLYWNEVKNTFPEAWGLPPTKSRLMHGAGIKAMGILMDRIMANIHPDEIDSIKLTRRYLERLRPLCAWTNGEWGIIDGRPWNAIQNTPTDIKALSNALIRAYIQTEKR